MSISSSLARATAAEAQEIYHAGFSDGSGPMRWGAVTEMSVPELKTWLDSGNTKKPLAYAPKPVAVPKEGAPKSLMQFLASKGGIREEAGELRALGLERKFVPGYGRLVRSSGMPLDQAREAAAEAGYPIGNGSIDDRMGTTTVRDFLDVLRTRRATASTPRPTNPALRNARTAPQQRKMPPARKRWKPRSGLLLSASRSPISPMRR
jgi:hypothetical protein